MVRTDVHIGLMVVILARGCMQQRQPKALGIRLVPTVLTIVQDRYAVNAGTVVGPLMTANLILLTGAHTPLYGAQ